MPDVFGLPLHPLVVHAVVVVVPLAAITVVLAAVLPRFRAWAGPLPLGLALTGLVLVPITTSSGESLEERVRETALVERHTEMGEQLLPFVAILAVVAAALYLARRRETQDRAFSQGIIATMAAVAVIGAAASVTQVVRIGHSGAESAWSDIAPAGSDRD